LDTRLPLSRWQALGVRRINGRALPRRNLKASLIIPDGLAEPSYLVYSNFRALRRWNRSNSFAVAVGTLADSYAENRMR
jgi:membrane-bound lytic murein transglycosylase B